MSNTVGYQLVTIGADGEPTYDGSGNPIPTGSVVELGVPRWGRILKKVRQDILLETELGRRYVYPQFSRQTYEFVFRILPNKAANSIELFRTLDEAVGGQQDPFLLYLDVDASPLSGLFVRKEPDFDEGPEQPITSGGSIIRSVDYTLRVTEEPTGLDILA